MSPRVVRFLTGSAQEMGETVRYYFALGAVAGLALVLPELGNVFFFSLLGIPLALLYWSAPALFCVWTLSYLAYRVFQHFDVLRLAKPDSALLALAVTVALLAAPPAVHNWLLASQIHHLEAEDINALTRPLPTDAIAIRAIRSETGKHATNCEETCQHLLLSGSAERVLMAEDTTFAIASPERQEASVFTLEEMPECPEIDPDLRANKLYLQYDGIEYGKGPGSRQDIRFGQLNGTCLVERKAMLSEADMVISHGSVRASAEWMEDKHVEPYRLTVHVRARDGDGFRMLYQGSNTSYRKLGPLYLPAGFEDVSGDRSYSLWRKDMQSASAARRGEVIDWPRALTDLLGFDLRLQVTDRHARAAAVLDRVEAADRPPTDPEWVFLRGYFEAYQFKQEAEVFRLSRRILQNDAFPLLPDLDRTARWYVRQGTPAEIVALRGALVSRLNTLEERSDWSDLTSGEQKRIVWKLSSAIKLLL